MRDAILFMDDLPERAALAYQRMTPDDQAHTIWCKSAAEAIDVLKEYSERLKKVFLDHDLGGDTVTHPGHENSGTAVVRYLEKIDPVSFTGCTFIIHSHNGYAGPRMVNRLNDSGFKAIYSPFGTGKL